MKKRFFYSHPMLGGLIAMLILYIACNACGLLASMVMVGIGDTSELVNTVANTSVMVAALICMPVFWLLNRKNGYGGPFKLQGGKVNDVWICIAVFAAVDIVSVLCGLLIAPGGFPQLPVPSLATILLAIYAGVNEEVLDRCIPIAVMLRGKPASRRIWAAVIITSMIFSLTHLINLFSGQDLAATIIQLVFSLGMGFFFAALYLRTGSILPSILLHALHDLMAFVCNPLPPDDETNFVFMALIFLAKVLPFVFGVLLLLPKRHPSIIAAWARIWPEKNAPAAETVSQ